MSKEIAEAIELLKETGSIRLYDFVLITNENNVIVNIYSRDISIKNIVREIAIKEIETGEKEFIALRQESSLLSNFLMDKEVAFDLIYDTGFGSGVLICSKKNGLIDFY